MPQLLDDLKAAGEQNPRPECWRRGIQGFSRYGLHLLAGIDPDSALAAVHSILRIFMPALRAQNRHFVTSLVPVT